MRRGSDWSVSVRAACMLLGLGACGGEATPEPEYPPLVEPEPQAKVSEPPVENSAAPAPDEPAPPPPPAVSVRAGERTALTGKKTPSVRILAPRNGKLLKGKSVSVRLRVRHWLGDKIDPNNHVHVVVDNEPYIRVNEVKKAIDLGALMQEKLKRPLTPGTHLLRVFLGRPTHESVKEGKPFAMAVFHYQKKSEDFAFDAKAPLLTYSRPKACVSTVAPALLDFYLTNVEALDAKGVRVRYIIDGNHLGDITAWTPHYIENLQPGEHTLRLQLIDKEGKVIAGPYNDTTRTFVAQAQCPGQAPAAAGAASPADAGKPAAADKGASASDAKSATQSKGQKALEPRRVKPGKLWSPVP